MMTAERMTLSLADGVADVRLNRPDKLNALDEAQYEAIAHTIAEIEGRRDIRCVVLSGEGRAFSVGIDLDRLGQSEALRELEKRSHGDANIFQQSAWGWRTLSVPVIAAVTGYAFGAGCQIALGADMRIIAPDAEMSVMEIRWGLVPDVAGMALTRGLIREDRLRDLILTGRRVKGEEAVDLGLATRVAADPHAAAMEAARAIASSSPDAIRAAKRLLGLPWETSDAALLLEESREQQVLLASDNHREAVRAGQEKRAPVYRD
jgi:enoyl-CoA hydratase/carnithine racemase